MKKTPAYFGWWSGSGSSHRQLKHLPESVLDCHQVKTTTTKQKHGTRHWVVIIVMTMMMMMLIMMIMIIQQPVLRQTHRCGDIFVNKERKANLPRAYVHIHYTCMKKYMHMHRYSAHNTSITHSLHFAKLTHRPVQWTVTLKSVIQCVQSHWLVVNCFRP